MTFETKNATDFGDVLDCATLWFILSHGSGNRQQFLTGLRLSCDDKSGIITHYHYLKSLAILTTFTATFLPIGLKISRTPQPSAKTINYKL